ncbi:unnamed protein product [Protopolystoma xenopodis]|uniref:Uncharacterized protein n=1 Tax=Protopolystoma xenopodis TaxID=117903 RepID=A0A3S5AIX0_9PLAT|nr:unnamed protein product [Protopolystoma xenopodis]
MSTPNLRRGEEQIPEEGGPLSTEPTPALVPINAEGRAPQAGSGRSASGAVDPPDGGHMSPSGSGAIVLL